MNTSFNYNFEHSIHVCLFCFTGQVQDIVSFSLLCCPEKKVLIDDQILKLYLKL